MVAGAAREALRRGIPRRAFLRTALLGSAGAGLGAFSLASLGFLWPTLVEGFGAAIPLGPAQDVLDAIAEDKAPLAHPAGRLYVVAWDPDVAGAKEAYGDDHIVLESGEGLMALYHKCPHLGCRVPWCQTSQWFECPCHGSKYNRWGEWMSGPAPRGMDRFPTRLDNAGTLIADTGTVLTGPARTARVLQQDPEGLHCIDL